MGEWYAVQTKPHKELVARGALACIEDVEIYLPVVRVEPVNPRARKVRPFFPGYLFVNVDLAKVGLSALRWVPGVVRVVDCGGVPVSIPQSVIEQIRHRVEEEQRDSGLRRFRQGDRVRVTSGPFEGFEGMFDTHLQGRLRAQILIDFLGRLAKTEVDIQTLEKL